MDNKRYFVKISPLLNEEEKTIQINTELLEVIEDDNFDNLEFFHKHVADTIDITSFYMDSMEDDFALIVDDIGLMISGNVVVSIIYSVNGKEYKQALSGNVLVGKNKKIDFGYDTVGMTLEEAEDFLNNVKLDAYGIVR